MGRARCLVHVGWHLGDIICQFPALKHLSKTYDVYVQCEKKYETIFELIDYAKVGDPGEPCRFYDLQVFGNDQRIHDLFIGKDKGCLPVLYPYRCYDELRAAENDPIVFDRWPDMDIGSYEYYLVAPFGYSQKFLPGLNWMVKKAMELWPASLDKIWVLNDKPVEDCPFPVIMAENLSHLAGIIVHAKEFFTVNSAPTYVASVVRENYYHLHDPEGYDWTAENKILVYHERWPK